MCGLSGLYDPAARTGSWDVLARLHAPIRHRGPDGEGHVALDEFGRFGAQPAHLPRPKVGLAFRRLRILDLSAAADQPMVDPEGRCALVFNGEIYNHAELRSRLAAEGWRFRSHGDTEVVLAAWLHWGAACFARFEGMWAIVLADAARRRLVLSRDRFGIKPLVFARDDGRLLIASEAKQLLAARREAPRAHAGVVAWHLRGGRPPATGPTFFEGVREAPPACWAAVDLTSTSVAAPDFVPYWTLPAAGTGEPPPDYGAAVSRLDACLAATVASHTQADVTVGALLSGGLDSSTLVALHAARRSGRDFPTFSFGTSGGPVDERVFAEAVVRHTGVQNRSVDLTSRWVAEHALAVVRAVEEPPLALAAFAQHRVFALAAEGGATVVLDGQGADEVLGGYPYHERAALADAIGSGRLPAAAHDLRAIALREGRPVLDVVADHVLRPALAKLRRPAPAASAAGADPTWAEARACGATRLGRRFHWDVAWGNVRIMLGYSDRNAMAHSVEARVPYLDRAVVELAFSLPDGYKVGGGARKRVLRDVARRWLPAVVTERPDRVGFALPEEALMAELARDVEETLRDSAYLAKSLTPGALDAALAAWDAGRPGATRTIVGLWTLASWAAAFDVRP